MTEQIPSHELGPDAQGLITPLASPEGVEAFFEPAQARHLAYEAGIEPHEEDARDALLAEYLGNALAVEYYARRLLRQAYADHDAYMSRRLHELTGLPNRVAFLEEVERMGARAKDDDAVGVIIIDVNGFKGVNDRYGHRTGDELLIEVGQAMNSVVRTGTGEDIVTTPRIVTPSEEITVSHAGGDEFAAAVFLEDVLKEPADGMDAQDDMPAADLQREGEAASQEGAELERRGTAQKPIMDILFGIGNRLQEAARVPLAKYDVPGLGLSIGFSIWFPARGAKAKDVVESADKAMLREKRKAHQDVVGQLPPGAQRLLQTARVLIKEANYDPTRFGEQVPGDVIEDADAMQRLFLDAGEMLIGLAGFHFDRDALVPLEEVQPEEDVLPARWLTQSGEAPGAAPEDPAE
jgi:GGDEF domain-containing protein